MSKTRAFQCPNCGASLDYGGAELSIECPYCHTAVIVPEELRDRKPAAPEVDVMPFFGSFAEQAEKLRELRWLIRTNQQLQAVKLYREIFGVGLEEAKQAVDQLAGGKPVVIAGTTIDMGDVLEPTPAAFPAEPSKPPRPAGRFPWGWIVVLPAIIVALVAVGLFAIIGVRVSREAAEETAVVVAIPTSEDVIGSPTAEQEETPEPSFAQVAFTFGGEGIGPGRFADARHVAVDGEGNIYVGEYSDGRLQVFDPSGEFIFLWMVDNDTPLRGLAADRQGTIYIAQGGRILRYEGATGEFLGQVEYAEGRGFDDVVVTADGGLVGAWYRNRDDIVRFDAQGNAVLTIRDAISEQTGESELDLRVAVDGLGNIYALGRFNDAVFKFAPDGKFVNRFGSKGDEPGQFRAPIAITVDGQGRVYVGDFKGIQVFDADGRYLDLIEVDGPPFGMAFNDQHELFVVARHQVIKYVVQQPYPG